MMKFLLTLLFGLCLCLQLEAQTERVVRLWEHSKVKAHSVTLTYYLPEHKAEPVPAVIVCPGGSYCWHDRGAEGVEVARWLLQNGFAAFVLNYRVQGIFMYVTHLRALFGGRRHPDALQDVQRAMAWIQENAAQLGIDSQRIGVMGFSAGGHLAMSAAEFSSHNFLEGTGTRADVSLRPQFVASIYPVVTMYEPYVHKRSRRALLGERRKWKELLRDSLSLEHHVSQDCPPVFLVNCVDDDVVMYQNSVLLDSALTAHGVPHVYLQYKTGGHGFGASSSKGSSECREWKNEFLKWYKCI